MIICSCNVLTDHDVRSTVAGADVKPRSPVQVHVCLGCRVQCGRCASSIRRILEDTIAGYQDFALSQDCMMDPDESVAIG
jgi:bacterioferritin-associated ferredoxin